MEPYFGSTFMLVQPAALKLGWAHSGLPLTMGESPGANFHGPGRFTAELSRVMTSPDCGAAGALWQSASDARVSNAKSGSRRGDFICLRGYHCARAVVRGILRSVKKRSVK